MAQYEVGHCCGHTVTVDISGTNVHGEREAEAERRARKPCPACSRQQKRDQLARDSADAAARNASAGLPPLEGSEKQVAWAEQIRDDAVTMIADSVARSGCTDLVPAVTAVITRAASRQTSAVAWIDGRRDPRAVIKAAMNADDNAAYGELVRQAKESQ